MALQHLGAILARFKIRKVDLESQNQKGEKSDLVLGNVITSRDPEDDEFHKPVIDLDCPCYLLYSTNGNAHLLIDRNLSNEQYDKLLTCLKEIGLYEQGCYDNFKKAGFTGVRFPWLIKTGKSSKGEPS